MFVVPLLNAVTTPVAEFTVATAVLVLVHTPPGSPLVEYVVTSPMQSGDVPLTVPATTFGLTVIVAVPETEPVQPFASVTETRLYVVVEAGETAILLPLM